MTIDPFFSMTVPNYESENEDTHLPLGEGFRFAHRLTSSARATAAVERRRGFVSRRRVAIMGWITKFSLAGSSAAYT
jgi:hypothetical protein